jgi:hypothetical protein|tara:strand:- start:112 stop:873 length:762 start_codon:yes stop_codon:yes gene_type:complete
MRVKCEEVMFKPINALTLRLVGGTTSIIPEMEDGTIVSLKFSDGILLEKGTTTTIEKRPYKINIFEKIFKNDKLFYDVKVAERNKSSIFILPMLGGTKHLMMYDKLLMNAFIGSDQDENCIVLLYRFSRETIFYKFEQALKKFKNYRRSYDPTPYFVAFVFEIPKEHRKNMIKFKQGKYSKMQDIYKLKILEYHSLDIDSPIGHILFKAEKRRLELGEKLGVILPEDSELLSIMNKEDEILNPNYYFENDKKN